MKRAPGTSPGAQPTTAAACSYTLCIPISFIIFTPVVMILRNLLYFISVLLIAGWALGYYKWRHEGNVIHLLAFLAVASFVLSIYVSFRSKRSGNDI